MSVATHARGPGAWSRARQRFFRHEPADGERLVLRHSRIYILPTRRGFAVIATLLLMLLTSLNCVYAFLAVNMLLAWLHHEYSDQLLTIVAHPLYLIFG